MSQPVERSEAQRIEEAKKWAAIVYALQALGFVVGISYIAALFVAYLKRPEARGTWVESHFQWQISTFWYSLLWGVLGAVALMWMVGYFIIVAAVLWVVYRIVVGWVRLSDGKPAYVST